MRSRHAKINLNAAGGENGEGMVVSYREGGQVLGGCAPNSDALLGETNWANRTGMSLIVQTWQCQQLRGD